MKTLNEDFPPLGAAATVNTNGLVLLRAPFPAHQISKLPKPTKKQTDDVKADYRKGIRCQICGAWHHPDVVHLDYVGHAALTDRLLDSDPLWSWEPLALGQDGLPVIDKDGGMWIRLTVCGVTRLGYGSADGKTGGDAMKERIGDALRNAAMRFGAALDLWHKGDLHLEDEKKDEDDDSAEEQAMQVRILFNKGDIKGAATILNMLGLGGEYDADAKELVWGRLESNIRSAIKSYEAIVNAGAMNVLEAAWIATPKHSKHLLEPVKDKRKKELTQPEEKAAA